MAEYRPGLVGDSEVRWCRWPKPSPVMEAAQMDLRKLLDLSSTEQRAIVTRVLEGEGREQVGRAYRVSRHTIDRVLARAGQPMTPEARGRARRNGYLRRSANYHQREGQHHAA